MRIAIVDDCEQDRITLQQVIQDVFMDLGILIEELVLFHDGSELLDYLTFHSFDIIFLDIFMDELTGIQTARSIRECNKDVCLVFATSSNEFASESFEVDACHYILKPINQEKIRSVTQRIQIHQLLAKRSIVFPDGKKVLLKNIMYTEYCDHNIHLHMADNSMMVTRLQHAKLETMLSDYPQFFCSSKGILVNFEHVKHIEKLDFMMNNHTCVPISRRRRKAAIDAYHEYLFHRLKEDL